MQTLPPETDGASLPLELPMHLHRLAPARTRRGNYTWLLVLTLPVLLGFAAVAIDLSYQKVVRAELQAAADIAASAGADHIDGTAEGLVAARSAAIRAAARNEADGAAVVLPPQNIVFGYWDKQTREFIDSTDPEEIDAMRVWIRMDDIGTTFASIAFRDPMVSAQGSSAAVQQPPTPAGAVSCYIPLAVPDCMFENNSPEALANFTLKVNPAGVDNVGWARVGASPNANWTRDQIRDCHQDGLARVGDEVGLQNGVVTSALSELVTAIGNSSTRWNSSVWGALPARHSGSAVSTANYGKTYEGAIIIFDGGPEYCQGSGGPYNQYETIVGFAWAAIYDVRTSGSSSQKNIWVKLDPLTDRVIGEKRGGRFDGGVLYDEPVAIVK